MSEFDLLFGLLIGFYLIETAVFILDDSNAVRVGGPAQLFQQPGWQEKDRRSCRCGMESGQCWAGIEQGPAEACWCKAEG